MQTRKSRLQIPAHLGGTLANANPLRTSGWISNNGGNCRISLCQILLPILLPVWSAVFKSLNLFRRLFETNEIRAGSTNSTGRLLIRNCTSLSLTESSEWLTAIFETLINRATSRPAEILSYFLARGQTYVSGFAKLVLPNCATFPRELTNSNWRIINWWKKKSKMKERIRWKLIVWRCSN